MAVAAYPNPYAARTSKNTAGYRAFNTPTPVAQIYQQPPPPSNPYAARTAKNTTGYAGFNGPSAAFAPPAPSPQPNSGGGGGGGGGGQSPLDWALAQLSAYPGFQNAQSLYNQQNANSASDLLAQARAALLQYGSANLAHSYLDQLLPQIAQYEQKGGVAAPDLGSFWSAFNGAADPNTGYSTLATLARTGLTNTRNMNNALLGSNLNKSSYGDLQRQTEKYNENKAQADALTAVQNALAGYLSGYQGSLASNQDAFNRAAEDARTNLINYALATQTPPPNPAPAPAPAPAAPLPPTIAGQPTSIGGTPLAPNVINTLRAIQNGATVLGFG